jgi:hypothetical protein
MTNARLYGMPCGSIGLITDTPAVGSSLVFACLGPDDGSIGVPDGDYQCWAFYDANGELQPASGFSLMNASGSTIVGNAMPADTQKCARTVRAVAGHL